MHGTDVSVVMVLRGSVDFFALPLAHLERQSYPAGRFELIVVNACPDLDQQALERSATGLPMRVRCVTALSYTEGFSRALARAEGRWILSLDEELLAGPSLVERHVRAQEFRGGNAVIVGDVEKHPQVPENTLTKWDALGYEVGGIPNAPLPWEEWEGFNCSCPAARAREAIAQLADPDLVQLMPLALAGKLSALGLQGYRCAEARAFSWRGVTLAQEYQRHYDIGYDIFVLCQDQDCSHLRAWAGAEVGFPARLRGRLARPFLRRTVSLLSSSTMFHGQACERLLFSYRMQGYADAAASRQRRAIFFDDVAAPRQDLSGLENRLSDTPP